MVSEKLQSGKNVNKKEERKNMRFFSSLESIYGRRERVESRSAHRRHGVTHPQSQSRRVMLLAWASGICCFPPVEVANALTLKKKKKTKTNLSEH